MNQTKILERKLTNIYAKISIKILKIKFSYFRLMIKRGSAYVEQKLLPFVKTDNFNDLVLHLNRKRKPVKTAIESNDVVVLEEVDFDNPTLGDMIGVDKSDW